MTDDATEAEVLQNLIPELEEEGYEVFLQPRPPVLPLFLRDFQPDAIAKRKDKNVVIEVVRSVSENPRLQQLAAAVKANPDWNLRVILATSTSRASPLKRQSPESITSAVSEIQRLYEAEHYSAALLMAWSTFEALGRLLMFEDFRRAQSPGRLVQRLAQEGYLVPSDADRLRQLAEKRNLLIHGNLETEISKSDIAHCIEMLKKLSTVAMAA